MDKREGLYEGKDSLVEVDKKGLQRTKTIKFIVPMPQHRYRSISGAYQALREGKLFEHFLVLGLPPKPTMESSNSIHPMVLYKYPPNKDSPIDVLPFCFIEKEKTLVKTNNSVSMTDLNAALYGTMSTLEAAANCFIQLFVHEEQVFYAVCVQHKELQERVPSFARKDPVLKTMTRRMIHSTSKSSSSITKRVYIFITRFPFFHLHFSVLFSILARERFHSLLDTSMNSAQVLRSNAPEPSTPNEVIEILNAYYDHVVPAPGKKIELQFPGEASIPFLSPEGNDDTIVADWCLPVLFQILQLDHILTLLSAAMLDYSIVIECTNLGILSCLVLSIIPMLRPFIWQGPLIPYLPKRLHEYLNSPVPFVAGVQHLSRDLEQELNTNTTILKLIKRSQDGEKLDIWLHSRNKLPPLPRQKQLEAELKPLHAQLYNSNQHSNPYRNTKDQIALAKSIMQVFQRYHKALLDPIVPYVNPLLLSHQVRIEEEQGLEIVAGKKLLQVVPKNERDFIGTFVETQHFIFFVENMIAEYMKEEKKREMTTQIDEKLSFLEKQKKEALQAIQKYVELVEELDSKMESLERTKESLNRATHIKKQNLMRKSSAFISASVNTLRDSWEYNRRQEDDDE